MPTSDYAPMLALPYEQVPPEDPRWNWDAQRKVDGIRAMVYLGPQGKRVLTRVKGKHTGEYGVKTEHLPWLPDTEKDYVFDGELLWGRNSKECMKNLGCLPTESLKRQEATHPVCFVAFDILVGWGINLCPRPYFQRREALLDHGSFVAMNLDHKFQILKHFTDARSAWERAKSLEWEGIILKESFGTYEPGRRSPNWVKVKRAKKYVAVVTGQLAGKEGKTGQMLGRMGSLMLGMWNGKMLVPVGNCGTGFDMDERGPSSWPVHLVVEVESSDITEDGKLWHPRFIRRRPELDLRAASVEQIHEPA